MKGFATQVVRSSIIHFASPVLIQSFHVSGYFSRDGTDFTNNAENIDLSFRDDGVWLEADLGEQGRQGINLSDHVENQHGQLVFV